MLQCVVRQSHENKFGISFSDHYHRRRIVFGFSDKYKVHILFIVSTASIKIHLSIQSLVIVMGNPMKKT